MSILFIHSSIHFMSATSDLGTEIFCKPFLQILYVLSEQITQAPRLELVFLNLEVKLQMLPNA